MIRETFIVCSSFVHRITTIKCLFSTIYYLIIIGGELSTFAVITHHNLYGLDRYACVHYCQMISRELESLTAY